MKKFLFLTAALLIAMPAVAQDAKPVAPPPAGAAVGVTLEERAKIETVIRDLFQREPGIVMEAAQRYQQQAQEDQLKKAQSGIKDSAEELYRGKDSPVTGNPKGDVTVVEFFDYNCGYCKRATPTVNQLKAEDKNVRVVSKQYPILGPTSMAGAQAAVAAQLQGKFDEMHNALMANAGPLSEEKIIQLAGVIKGLDVTKFKADMKGDVVKKRIEADLALGQKIGVQGTPGFVIGDKLYPGAMDLEAFKKSVTEARAITKPKS